MKTITTIIKEAYIQGVNDSQENSLWKISAEKKALNYATKIVNENDLLPDSINENYKKTCYEK